MKRRPAALLFFSAMFLFILSGCGRLAEPEIPGYVRLPNHTSERSDSPDPEVFSSELPQIPEEVTEIDVSSRSYSGGGVRESDNGLEIYLPGTYRLSGESSEFVLSVDLIDDEAPVTLLFDGVAISSEYISPVFLPRASDCFIICLDGSSNSISGGGVPNAADVNAALWSMGNIYICGGELSVSGGFDNAVASKDVLRLSGADLTVSAPDDGIAGRDAVISDSSRITAHVGGDAVKATNLESGRVLMQNTELFIRSGLDGIDGCSYLFMSGCTADVVSGGGHLAVPLKIDDVPRVYDPLKPSYKAFKAAGPVLLENCTVTADCADDCLHSDRDLTVSGCTLSLMTADDGLHANGILTIRDTTADIGYCYEGLEGSSIFIDNLNASIIASDDGANASKIGGEFIFNSGYCFMVCAGDGIDSNGSLTLNGGTMIINGPTPDYNSVLDFSLDSGCRINGGTYISSGASGMALVPEASETAVVLSIVFSSQIQENIPITLTDGDGKLLVCFCPEKAWQNFQFSSPELQKGMTVRVYLGGTAGELSDCVSPRAAEGGVLVSEFVISSQIAEKTVALSD
ncbi:MAG: carbohydrate-binding domain-containing protein [Eubacteriales bacterium]